MHATAAPSPLHNVWFRRLWLAALASNVGSWMSDVGAGWMMTTLAPGALVVALVQAATTLPIFILTIPAGALADTFDRRAILLWTQTAMLIVAAGLALTTWLSPFTPAALLGFMLLMGIGKAVTGPPWQAVLADLVTREQLPAAATLNSLSVNLSRAVGPVLGGVVVGVAGAPAVFLLDAMSYAVIVFALSRWRPPPLAPAPLREEVWGALLSGIRYVRHAPPVRHTIYRSALFCVFAGGLWALLPVYARTALAAGPATYGLLLAMLGIGAVLGGLSLRAIRTRCSTEHVVCGATIVFAGSSGAAALSASATLSATLLLLTGGAWIAAVSSFSATIQTQAPAWVRGRAIATHLAIFFGALTAASLIWGLAADWIGVRLALLCAATGLGVTLAAARLAPLPGANVDVTPAPILPGHERLHAVELGEGPIRVIIDYRVGAERSAEFVSRMQHIGRIRRRDGAIFWTLQRDLGAPDVFVETFIAQSWAEHLRQHQRLTAADAASIEAARALLLPGTSPVVRHLGPADPQRCPPIPRQA